MRWVAICLKCRNEICYPGCENNQIAGTGSGTEGVWHTRWHKYRGSGTDPFGSVGIAECEFSLEYVPSFVVGIVDMQGCGATATPFMDAEGITRSGERCWSHSRILTPQSEDHERYGMFRQLTARYS